MGQTKIFVFSMRQIVKAGLLALGGLVVILMLIYMFLPKNKTVSAIYPYVPGTYTSRIVLHSRPVEVKVDVSETKILSVSMTDLGETQEVFYPLFGKAMEEISGEVIRLQSAQIAPSADYPITSGILIEAVQTALEKAVNSDFVGYTAQLN